MDNWHVLFDFDSTLVSVEGLELLADTILANRDDKDEVLLAMSEITKLGMEGKIPFNESLKRRIETMSVTQESIQTTIRRITSLLSNSIEPNIEFFHSHHEHVHILSGGFEEFIIPTVASLHIKPSRVYANTFMFDESGCFVGIDTDRHTAQENGKVRVVESLALSGTIIVVGDGYTDYQIKESGNADYFIAYTENIKREPVVAVADFVAHDMGEVRHFVNEILVNSGIQTPLAVGS